MTAEIQLSDSFPHATPDGYKQGCRGGICPGVIPCRDVHRSYVGDFAFRRMFDSGMSAADILNAEAEKARAELEAARAQRKPKPKRSSYPRRRTTGITTHLQAAIAHHHAEGLTDREIADRIGKTREQVQATRRHIGLAVNIGKTTDELIRELHAEGLNDIAIAARLGKVSDYVGTRRRRMKLPRNITHYTKVTDQQIRDLNQAGLNDRQVSEQLGIDQRTAAKRRRDLQLKINKETR